MKPTCGRPPARYDPSANGVPPDLYSSLQPFDADAHMRTAAPELAGGLPLAETDIADIVAFLEALTDPAAQDLDWLLPESVPSGLPLDAAPLEPAPQRATPHLAAVQPEIAGDIPLDIADDEPSTKRRILPAQRGGGVPASTSSTAPSPPGSTRTQRLRWAAASAGSTTTATAGSTSTL